MFSLGNEEHDLIQRTMCSDLDLDEYSAKATRTLYIGNLPSDISYQELRETYSVYGEIIVSDLSSIVEKNIFQFRKSK